MKYKRILILGATGRTGRLLLRQALDRGYQVNVLVRIKNSFSPRHPNLKIFEGTPTNKTALTKAMENCEAVISTLNISRNSDFPWSKLRTPSNFLSETVSNIISLSSNLGISRVIVLSAWGVGDTANHIPRWFKWFIDHSNIGVAYRDHARQEELLALSALLYTVIRPVGLINSDKEKNTQVSLNNVPEPALTISRRNVANFIIETLEQDLYVFKMPVIYM
ncbi:MAG: NAD(P)H-binding protein [Dyadobacter sp.]